VEAGKLLFSAQEAFPKRKTSHLSPDGFASRWAAEPVSKGRTLWSREINGIGWSFG
jgi:hypothetical protein